MVYVDGVGLSEGGLLSLEAEDVFTSPKQRPGGGRYGEIGAHACQIFGRMGRYGEIGAHACQIGEIWGDMGSYGEIERRRVQRCSAALRLYSSPLYSRAAPRHAAQARRPCPEAGVFCF